MWHYTLQFLHSTRFIPISFRRWTDYTDPGPYHFRKYSSVPTQNQILVPETLLKKRKSQEQARAATNAELVKRKQVCFLIDFSITKNPKSKILTLYFDFFLLFVVLLCWRKTGLL